MFLFTLWGNFGAEGRMVSMRTFRCAWFPHRDFLIETIVPTVRKFQCSRHPGTPKSLRRCFCSYYTMRKFRCWRQAHWNFFILGTKMSSHRKFLIVGTNTSIRRFQCGNQIHRNFIMVGTKTSLRKFRCWRQAQSCTDICIMKFQCSRLPHRKFLIDNFVPTRKVRCAESWHTENSS